MDIAAVEKKLDTVNMGLVGKITLGCGLVMTAYSLWKSKQVSALQAESGAPTEVVGGTIAILALGFGAATSIIGGSILVL